jgi:hypothetical protein
MRGSVDVQEAATVGGFVWIADNFRSGNVGMQQPGEIAERQRDAPRKLSFGCDCHATQRSSLARELSAGREIVRAWIVARDFGFGVAAFQLRCVSPLNRLGGLSAFRTAG